MFLWNDLDQTDKTRILHVIAKEALNEKSGLAQFPEYESVWEWGSDYILRLMNVHASPTELEFTFRLHEWVEKEVM